MDSSENTENTSELSRRQSVRRNSNPDAPKESNTLELSLPNSPRNESNHTDTTSIADGHANKKQIEWSPENEMIMVEWCDIAQCYKWLNARAHAKYSYMHAWYTIPAITLSTISGTASFAQASLPLSYQQFAPMVIGTINILIGILTTIQQYLKISELNEAHRVSSIAWDKFARNIRIELAKKPEERMDAGNFLKFNRQEFDRLMETSPMIKENVIQEFTAKLSGREGTIERKRFDDLKKPDICNTIVSANETRHHWYLDKDKDKDKDIDIFDISIDEEAIKSKDELIRSQQRKITESNNELKRKEREEMDKIKKQKEELEKIKRRAIDEVISYKEQTKCLDDYIVSFKNIYDRNPMRDEIYNNMKEDVDQIGRAHV